LTANGCRPTLGRVEEDAMKRFVTIRSFVSMVFVVLLAGALPAAAADSPVGTWLRKDEPAQGGGMTMVIEQWGDGRAKLTYRTTGNVTMTIVSKLDGSDAPLLVNGKPSGQTMGIKLLDKRHSVTVLKLNGQKTGISKGTFSADFNTLTVENDIIMTAGSNDSRKFTETWVRK
jgi:hypothetical protein